MTILFQAKFLVLILLIVLFSDHIKAQECKGSNPTKWNECYAREYKYDGCKYSGYIRNGLPDNENNSIFKCNDKEYIGSWLKGKKHDQRAPVYFENGDIKRMSIKNGKTLPFPFISIKQDNIRLSKIVFSNSNYFYFEDEDDEMYEYSIGKMVNKKKILTINSSRKYKNYIINFYDQNGIILNHKSKLLSQKNNDIKDVYIQQMSDIDKYFFENELSNDQLTEAEEKLVKMFDDLLNRISSKGILFSELERDLEILKEIKKAKNNQKLLNNSLKLLGISKDLLSTESNNKSYQSGFNKICEYDTPTGKKVITLENSLKACPLAAP